jgi:hypothetical protein
MCEAWQQSTIRREVVTEERNSLYGTVVPVLRNVVRSLRKETWRPAQVGWNSNGSHLYLKSQQGHRRSFHANAEIYLISGQAPRHEDVWGNGGTAPPFLILALDGGEWSASRLGRDRRLVGPRSRSGRYGEEKILPLMGIEPWPSSPTLYWLNYPASFNYYLTVNVTGMHLLQLLPLVSTAVVMPYVEQSLDSLGWRWAQYDEPDIKNERSVTSMSSYSL